MQQQFLSMDDGVRLALYHWPAEPARGVLVLVHGMAEHGDRYDRFAQAAVGRGLAVVALDLRGHGRTAAVNDQPLGYLGPQGWPGVVTDILRTADWAQARYPGLPLYLFGHSMGSVFARAVLQRDGGRFQACVLSGVTVNTNAVLRRVSIPLTALVCLVRPADRPSKFLDRLSFGSFNHAFEPNRTAFDWLSRDEAEVDAYVDDPLCGFVCSPQLFREVARMVAYTVSPAHIRQAPDDLPVLVLSGSEDPVGGNGAAAAYLEKTWKACGKRLRSHLYPGGRHELLNDTCREEVTAEILDFFLQEG
mgnify:CR=1 FL=1